MVQGHVPAGALLQEGTEKGLVLRVTSHGHIPLHMLKDGAEWPTFQTNLFVPDLMSTKLLRRVDYGTEKGEERC